MFTGIIIESGATARLDLNTHYLHVLAPQSFWHGITTGASVACSGVCLTLVTVNYETGEARFFVGKHTRTHTALTERYSTATSSIALNIERALRYGDELGGHVFSGHITDTAHIVAIEHHADDSRRLDFEFECELDARIMLQASIALDGVSLTISAVHMEQRRCSVELIPATLENTTLGVLGVGDLVNVERAPIAQMNPKLIPQWLNEARYEGERGRATAAPNPWVGCIIVARDGVRELGRGSHRCAGNPHAEIEAIRNVVDATDLEGAHVYVTLEPCTHYGRTPPCVDALIAAKVSRVTVGMRDPDERARGGVEALRAANIDVSVINDADIVKQLRAYSRHRTTARPLVIAKVALTLDGCIGYRDATSAWITGAAAREHVRCALWNYSQAIVFGARTIEQDNPTLNDATHSLIVILGSLRSNSLNICAHKRVRAYHYGSTGTCCSVPCCELIDLDALLEALAVNDNVLQVTVEGGSRTHAHFLAADAVDELWVYRGAALAGASGRHWLGDELEYGRSMGGIGRLTIMDAPERVDACTVLTRYQVRRALPTPALRCATEALHRGNVVCVLDDSARENEGDLIVAARHFDPEHSAMFRRFTTNMVCAPMSRTHAAQLDLSPMVKHNEDTHQTPFSVTCDASVLPDGTGVSALDRVATFAVLARGDAAPNDLRRPGHVFPLLAATGGIRERQGHTEAAVALCMAANIEPPVAAIAELQTDAGSMMTPSQCEALCREFNLPLLHINELVAAAPPSLLCCRRLASCTLELAINDGISAFILIVYSSSHSPRDIHKVLIRGTPPSDGALCRVHSECFTGDVLASQLCDCGAQLHGALEAIDKRGAGVCIIVGGHEGRG